MMLRLAFVAFMLLGVVACSKGPGAADQSWAPAGACKFVGNRADRHYCATTAIQILANPERYDGKLILVSGWLVVGEGKGFLYLSREALDGAELHGALALLPSASPKATNSGPYPARIAGRFHLNRTSPEGKGALRNVPWNAFGSLDEVEVW
ncbi:hypothetical protein [Lysobacter sp. GCM10012299]|uniref:hypothetical protein n=1 Tax=Lysobacter sp. GCM10012299 TaxID=3317333 RepID=UPI0036D87DBB